jgi:acyl-CoA thioesterase FadM
MPKSALVTAKRHPTGFLEASPRPGTGRHGEVIASFLQSDVQGDLTTARAFLDEIAAAERAERPQPEGVGNAYSIAIGPTGVVIRNAILDGAAPENYTLAEFRAALETWMAGIERARRESEAEGSGAVTEGSSMSAWTETCRSVVSPWECDVTEHFTIAYYFDRLADASATIAESLGLPEPSGTVGRRFDVRFARELRAGASFHILSAPIALDENSVRLGHQIIDSADGEVTAWVEETLARATTPLPEGLGDEIGRRLAAWPGPAVEQRPEPVSTDKFVATARDRIKPTDLDTGGKLALAGFVHRFTAGNIQALAAIGANSAYMQAERRGYSTFELALRIAGSPQPGALVLVETGIAHLGSSSIRFVHRMSDPVSRTEYARLSQFGVQLDLDKRRPAALPETLRAAATRLLVPVASLGD